MTDKPGIPDLDLLTRRAVRSFWMDGLWELAFVGALLLTGFWGMIFVQFVVFPERTWPFLSELGRNTIWIGLLVILIAGGLYIWFAWILVKRLKRLWVSPHTGHADHRFLMPVEPRVFLWYFILYLSGLALLYGLFACTLGGAHAMSVPFIISPAAMLWAIGSIYSIRRYRVFAVTGLILAILLELLLTWPASYPAGPHDFLNVRPEWGSPALPCFVWAAIFLFSGLTGLAHVRRLQHEP